MTGDTSKNQLMWILPPLSADNTDNCSGIIWKYIQKTSMFELFLVQLEEWN